MMNRLLRWIGIVISLLVLAIVAYAVVYVLSERILRHPYEVPAVALSIPTDAAPIAEGRRLAIVRGCFNGCDGTGLNGYSTPDFDAPDLRIVAAYSPGQFAELVRTGVALGARNLATMSNWARAHQSHLTDKEIDALYSYLHSMPEAGPQ